eukprot:TRINITY_DN15131_c0_g2_i1.p1 TRINITY_DN15131_c0_g2~~TRINITY_DN15131_c0_g2_i1.p1  ORF type:complete len:239 (+),score=26.16 TRINITY_DN15131_c0_g2_i1:33-749(+)
MVFEALPLDVLWLVTRYLSELELLVMSQVMPAWSDVYREVVQKLCKGIDIGKGPKGEKRKVTVLGGEHDGVSEILRSISTGQPTQRLPYPMKQTFSLIPQSLPTEGNSESICVWNRKPLLSADRYFMGSAAHLIFFDTSSATCCDSLIHAVNEHQEHLTSPVLLIGASHFPTHPNAALVRSVAAHLSIPIVPFASGVTYEGVPEIFDFIYGCFPPDPPADELQDRKKPFSVKGCCAVG